MFKYPVKKREMARNFKNKEWAAEQVPTTSISAMSHFEGVAGGLKTQLDNK